ncbi:hypothetical protein [Neorhizobium sp. DAR64872/K0K18]|uniref:hypothetical protein n=1 Tax=Neorhizobium sp. DAR64872/K0K18 TaxID=3421958 RepID=UPI003D284C55
MSETTTSNETSKREQPMTADEAWSLFDSRRFLHGHRETMRESFIIALKEFTACPSKAHGQMLVPVVATEEMELAAIKRVAPYHDQRWYSVMPKDLFRLAWPAMLAAAPKPLKAGERGGAA